MKLLFNLIQKLYNTILLSISIVQILDHHKNFLLMLISLHDQTKRVESESIYCKNKESALHELTSSGSRLINSPAW